MGVVVGSTSESHYFHDRHSPDVSGVERRRVPREPPVTLDLSLLQSPDVNQKDEPLSCLSSKDPDAEVFIEIDREERENTRKFVLLSLFEIVP